MCTVREFFVLFFVSGRKRVASYFSFIFRPTAEKIFFAFGGFTFFSRKRKNHFWSTSIRRHYFTGCTHYTRIGLCIPRFSQTVTNLQFSADLFFFTKIASKCIMFRALHGNGNGNRSMGMGWEWE